MIWHNIIVHYGVVSQVPEETDSTLKPGNRGEFKDWTVYKGVGIWSLKKQGEGVITRSWGEYLYGDSYGLQLEGSSELLVTSQRRSQGINTLVFIPPTFLFLAGASCWPNGKPKGKGTYWGSLQRSASLGTE